MMKRFRGIVFALLVAVMATGCSTQVVPPGNVVMVLKANGEASIHKSGSFVAYGRYQAKEFHGKHEDSM
jgi:hypothetical protein